jgi:hypothetical protein
MMHPQSHPTTPSPSTAASAWEPVPDTTDRTDETPLSHADYNLQPLRVQALDHYVSTAGEDERFFVR